MTWTVGSPGKLACALLLIVFAQAPFDEARGNAIAAGERSTLTSTFLDEIRTFQVYLPPSYFFTNQRNYPVVYLMDGDYNFHHGTGLIELLSSVSERIPEMIVVGISDKGSANYRRNCQPTDGSDASGNADNFMSFLQKELMPHVDKTYRTSGYDILVGHSMGGLFTVNALLERPEMFDTYIAIDPALWWNDDALIERADHVFAELEALPARLYLSLADLKEMGTRKLVSTLEAYFPDGERWHFSHYPDESHDPVGLITLKTALEHLFAGWEMPREKFESLGSAKAISAHYRELEQAFDARFGLPSRLVGRAVHFFREDEQQLKALEAEIDTHFPASLDEFYVRLAALYLEKGDLPRAEEIYMSNLKRNGLSFRSYDGLSKVYFEQQDYEKARVMAANAVDLARKMKARQWLLNELMANYERVARKLE